MNNTRILSRALAASGIVLSVLSCGVHKARIDDRTDFQVELLTVDGQPVERARSRFVTVVPMALVDPGPHTFQVRMRAAGLGAPGETLLVQGTVTAGKRYRFESDAGTLRLVRTRDGE